MKNIQWFKEYVAPILTGYEIHYRFYEEGDFGSLNQVFFTSKDKGGGVDFWGLGWVGIDVYDYKQDKQLMNVLLEPHQEDEKEKAFSELRRHLNIC